MGDPKRWDDWLDGTATAGEHGTTEHLERAENEEGAPQIEHRIWMRKDWWDLEPDRFSMQVQNAEGDPERFLVVSGNATWLSVQQAKEVRDYLDACIRNIETLGAADPGVRADPPRRHRPRR